MLTIDSDLPTELSPEDDARLQKLINDFRDPQSDFRKRYEVAIAKIDEELKPVYDAIEDSQRITSKDLAFFVGPCPTVFDR